MTADLTTLRKRVAAASGLHERLANCHPLLQRGLVQCRTCKRIEKVDSAHCFRHGWPVCHGATMTIDVEPTALLAANEGEVGHE